jgi:carotenoid cleavage dioxygenase-like enzyme
VGRYLSEQRRYSHCCIEYSNSALNFAFAMIQGLIKGKPLVRFDEGRASRFGVLPKSSEVPEKIRWFEMPAMFAFHVANAWQEGNSIRLFACMYTEGVRFNL